MHAETHSQQRAARHSVLLKHGNQAPLLQVLHTVAERAKQFIVPRMTPAKEMANRTMLEKFIKDVYYRLNDDYTKPVVVIKSLDEVFLVTLEMDPETGIYQPVKLDWLKKKRKR